MRHTVFRWGALCVVALVATIAVAAGGEAPSPGPETAAPILGVPATPTALHVHRTTRTTIALAWIDNARGETRYEARFRAEEIAAWTVKRLRAEISGWTHRGLTAGTTYVYQVRACDGAECSAWSKRVRGTTTGSAQPVIGGCTVFPADNAWNTDISAYPLHPNSRDFIASIDAGGNRYLHADFGENQNYGIPYTVVPEHQPKVPIRFVDYGDESDPGPYPVPRNAPIEAGSDRHVLVLQRGACKLYELYNAVYRGPGWDASSGAVFDLATNKLRPDTWTSADAAGLPILPGLARYDEVAAGAINHALRFTVEETQRGFIHPATHYASYSDDPDLPPMGLRLRLKAGYDISRFHGQARVILDALKRYGMIVADNGSSWFISGATDPGWDDEDLNQLKTVPGSAFEVVDTGPILHP